MLFEMNDEEIQRLRKAIRRTYASQPHKIKCWLGLLEMFGRSSTGPADPTRGPDRLLVPRAGVNPSSEA
jgi:hypothetical protein